ncbi:hypothetical protein BJ878DRAFT_543676 [Calycina marina]|uniref:Uncharacterized protein n=1 Tax=Calycina marina TaxID=1763456 RepID=A0A9P7Z065_9HELO|nr:hypothetical protein BJ878DRAFT_543676 [Calycina marina]
MPSQEWWLAVWIVVLHKHSVPLFHYISPSDWLIRVEPGLEQVEETVAEGLRRAQLGAIEQVPTAAEVINPGNELVEDILEELEIVRSIAEAHNPALDEDSGDEEELEPPISNYEA